MRCWDVGIALSWNGKCVWGAQEHSRVCFLRLELSPPPVAPCTPASRVAENATCCSSVAFERPNTYTRLSSTSPPPPSVTLSLLLPTPCTACCSSVALEMPNQSTCTFTPLSPSPFPRTGGTPSGTDAGAPGAQRPCGPWTWDGARWRSSALWTPRRRGPVTHTSPCRSPRRCWSAWRRWRWPLPGAAAAAAGGAAGALGVRPEVGAGVNVNVNELRLGFSNSSTRNPQGILSHNSRRVVLGHILVGAASWVCSPQCRYERDMWHFASRHQRACIPSGFLVVFEKPNRSSFTCFTCVGLFACASRRRPIRLR
jgi:hypothetical protein